jgi:hypothetical protein
MRRSPADVQGCGTGVLCCGDCRLAIRYCGQKEKKREKINAKNIQLPQKVKNVVAKKEKTLKNEDQLHTT